MTKLELDNAERHARYLAEVWSRIEGNSQCGKAADFITTGLTGIIAAIEKERSALSASAPADTTKLEAEA